MNRNWLIQQVALRMDEVSPDITVADITVDGADGNPLYALIDGLVDAGALELFSVAPYWRLPQTTFTYVKVDALPSALGDASSSCPGGSTTVTNRYVIRIKVPDDFLRVAEINCTQFLRPITEIFPEVSDVGKRQHNRYLMGKEVKPVGVMSHGDWPTGVGTATTPCREIDCYSLSTQISDSYAYIQPSYIAKPEAIDDDDTNTDAVEEVVPEVLVDALVWLIAARTFGARGDANHAAICQQNAQNLLV